MVEQMNTQEAPEIIDGEGSLDKEEKQVLEALSEKDNKEINKMFEKEEINEMIDHIEGEREHISIDDDSFLEDSELISKISDKLIDIRRDIEQKENEKVGDNEKPDEEGGDKVGKKKEDETAKVPDNPFSTTDEIKRQNIL